MDGSLQKMITLKTALNKTLYLDTPVLVRN